MVVVSGLGPLANGDSWTVVPGTDATEGSACGSGPNCVLNATVGSVKACEQVWFDIVSMLHWDESFLYV